MPTIEIVSINSSGLELNQADFSIAIIEENKLLSHRGLFYDILRKQNGVIVHIGNPDFKDDKEGGFFAGQIIDWDFGQAVSVEPGTPENQRSDQGFRFKFLEQYQNDINCVLKIAFDKSLIRKVFFLTDYQFGPVKGNIEIMYTIDNFWMQHNMDGLVFNTLYELNKE